MTDAATATLNDRHGPGNWTVTAEDDIAYFENKLMAAQSAGDSIAATALVNTIALLQRCITIYRTTEDPATRVFMVDSGTLGVQDLQIAMDNIKQALAYE